MHLAVRPLCAKKSPVFSEGHWAAGANGDVFITACAMRTHVAKSMVDKLIDYVVNIPEDGLRSSIWIRQSCEVIRNNQRLEDRRLRIEQGPRTLESFARMRTKRKRQGNYRKLTCPGCCQASIEAAFPSAQYALRLFLKKIRPAALDPANKIRISS